MSFRETERHWKRESAQQNIERERFIFSETPQRKQHVIFLVIFFLHTYIHLLMEMENSHHENI